MATDIHRRVVLGVEVEAYTINTADHQIGRKLARPRPGLSERGERFTRDASIGSEYNSRPFTSIREAEFLLRAGIRKYLRGLYRSKSVRTAPVPMLVGGWSDRFAGTHVHISVADRPLDKETAASLSWHIHDQLPFLIALGANSPIWGRTLTTNESNRMLRGSDAYFEPTVRGRLTSVATREMVYSKGRKTKPATLEIRVLDANLPDFVVVQCCLIKAICLRWLRRKGAANRIRHDVYLTAREDAGRRGMRAKLPWRDDWLTVPRYLDRFMWEHRDEFEQMDVPDDVYEVLRLLKRGYNGSHILREAVKLAQEEKPRAWEKLFASRYSTAIERLLSGDSLHDFAEHLGLELPDTDKVWLGRKRASIDGW